MVERVVPQGMDKGEACTISVNSATKATRTTW